MSDKLKCVGITETGDPCFHLEIFDRLYDANIIITKNLTNKLIEKLIEHQDKCIMHLTVTGMGGSKIEPLVPTVEKSYTQAKKLVNAGFPAEQIVLRVDPIIPTEKGINTALNVLYTFKELGIERVRISFLDMYNHVKERFFEANIKLPYETFHADKTVRKEGFNKLYTNALLFGYKTVETCGEPDFDSVPCLSQTDIDILGLADKIQLEGNKGQRNTCGCPGNKKELIIGQKPHQCENKCMYCYWRD